MPSSLETASGAQQLRASPRAKLARASLAASLALLLAFGGALGGLSATLPASEAASATTTQTSVQQISATPIARRPATERHQFGAAPTGLPDPGAARRANNAGLQANVSTLSADGRPVVLAEGQQNGSHLLLLFALLVLINLIVILGNILVILAVYATVKLRSVTNIFIVSLATADLLLGVFVLPYALMFEILDVWVFGELWCRGWLVTDVWISTASILNLCAISIDRYVAVTRPVKYRSIMTPRRARTIVAGVWVVSFLICFPPLLSQWNPSSSLQVNSTAGLNGFADTERQGETFRAGAHHHNLDEAELISQSSAFGRSNYQPESLHARAQSDTSSSRRLRRQVNDDADVHRQSWLMRLKLTASGADEKADSQSASAKVREQLIGVGRTTTTATTAIYRPSAAGEQRRGEPTGEMDLPSAARDQQQGEAIKIGPHKEVSRADPASKAGEHFRPKWIDCGGCGCIKLGPLMVFVVALVGGQEGGQESGSRFGISMPAQIIDARGSNDGAKRHRRANLAPSSSSSSSLSAPPFSFSTSSSSSSSAAAHEEEEKPRGLANGKHSAGKQRRASSAETTTKIGAHRPDLVQIGAPLLCLARKQLQAAIRSNCNNNNGFGQPNDTNRAQNPQLAITVIDNKLGEREEGDISISIDDCRAWPIVGRDSELTGQAASRALIEGQKERPPEKAEWSGWWRPRRGTSGGGGDGGKKMFDSQAARIKCLPVGRETFQSSADEFIVFTCNSHSSLGPQKSGARKMRPQTESSCSCCCAAKLLDHFRETIVKSSSGQAKEHSLMKSSSSSSFTTSSSLSLKLEPQQQQQRQLPNGPSNGLDTLNGPGKSSLPASGEPTRRLLIELDEAIKLLTSRLLCQPRRAADAMADERGQRSELRAGVGVGGVVAPLPALQTRVRLSSFSGRQSKWKSADSEGGERQDRDDARELYGAAERLLHAALAEVASLCLKSRSAEETNHDLHSDNNNNNAKGQDISGTLASELEANKGGPNSRSQTRPGESSLGSCYCCRLCCWLLAIAKNNAHSLEAGPAPASVPAPAREAESNAKWERKEGQTNPISAASSCRQSGARSQCAQVETKLAPIQRADKLDYLPDSRSQFHPLRAHFKLGPMQDLDKLTSARTKLTAANYYSSNRARPPSRLSSKQTGRLAAQQRQIVSPCKTDKPPSTKVRSKRQARAASSITATSGPASELETHSDRRQRTITGKHDEEPHGRRRHKTGCALFDDKPYVIYSALGSFYIPMLIMIFFYSRIYLVASRAQKAMQRGYMTTKWPAGSGSGSRGSGRGLLSGGGGGTNGNGTGASGRGRGGSNGGPGSNSGRGGGPGDFGDPERVTLRIHRREKHEVEPPHPPASDRQVSAVTLAEQPRANLEANKGNGLPGPGVAGGQRRAVHLSASQSNEIDQVQQQQRVRGKPATSQSALTKLAAAEQRQYQQPQPQQQAPTGAAKLAEASSCVSLSTATQVVESTLGELLQTDANSEPADESVQGPSISGCHRLDEDDPAKPHLSADEPGPANHIAAPPTSAAGEPARGHAHSLIDPQSGLASAGADKEDRDPRELEQRQHDHLHQHRKHGHHCHHHHHHNRHHHQHYDHHDRRNRAHHAHHHHHHRRHRHHRHHHHEADEQDGRAQTSASEQRSSTDQSSDQSTGASEPRKWSSRRRESLKLISSSRDSEACASGAGELLMHSSIAEEAARRTPSDATGEAISLPSVPPSGGDESSINSVQITVSQFDEEEMGEQSAANLGPSLYLELSQRSERSRSVDVAAPMARQTISNPANGSAPAEASLRAGDHPLRVDRSHSCGPAPTIVVNWNPETEVSESRLIVSEQSRATELEPSSGHRQALADEEHMRAGLSETSPAGSALSLMANLPVQVRKQSMMLLSTITTRSSQTFRRLSMVASHPVESLLRRSRDSSGAEDSDTGASLRDSDKDGRHKKGSRNRKKRQHRSKKISRSSTPGATKKTLDDYLLQVAGIDNSTGSDEDGAEENDDEDDEEDDDDDEDDDDADGQHDEVENEKLRREQEGKYEGIVLSNSSADNRSPLLGQPDNLLSISGASIMSQRLDDGRSDASNIQANMADVGQSSVCAALKAVSGCHSADDAQLGRSSGAISGATSTGSLMDATTKNDEEAQAEQAKGDEENGKEGVKAEPLRPSALHRQGGYYERATSRTSCETSAGPVIGNHSASKPLSMAAVLGNSLRRDLSIGTGRRTTEGQQRTLASQLGLQVNKKTRRRGAKRTSRWHAKRLHAETKAAKTVAIIIGGFIFCWLPFFTAYLSRAIICERPDCVPQSLLSVFIWLGYLNSAINPVIYGLFSADFRHAFKNILCRCRFRNTDDTVVVSVLVDSIIKSIL